MDILVWIVLFMQLASFEDIRSKARHGHHAHWTCCVLFVRENLSIGSYRNAQYCSEASHVHRDLVSGSISMATLQIWKAYMYLYSL